MIMRRLTGLVSLALLLILGSTGLLAAEGESGAAGAAKIAPQTDWPWWRGPSGDGIAYSAQQPPLEWSAEKNIVWKSSIPGRGHASPIVVGKRVFLTTADVKAEVRSVLCFDRQTGRQLWKTDVHTGKMELKGHQKSSQASATPACDGERVYVNFLHDGGVFTTALDLAGNQVWQTRISDFVTHQGFGSSPAIYQSLLLVASDNKVGGVVAALDRKTGKIIWKQDRPKLPNYTSPAVLKVAGRQQLLLAGCDHLSSFDPLTGQPIWDIEGSTTECVGSVVTDGQLIFASGGYPKKLTQAVRADGSGEIAWENDTQTYVPSMLVHDKHLYTITDGGIAICWEAATGKEAWRNRLGGTFNASSVLVGDQIFATNQEGDTFIFRATPEKYEQLGKNHLGEDVFATPAICGSQIFLRSCEIQDGARQEWLYCIGAK